MIQFKKNCSYIAGFNFKSFYYFFPNKIAKEQSDFIESCNVKLKQLPEKYHANDLNILLTTKGIFEDNFRSNFAARKFVKNLKEDNSIHLLIKAYWSYSTGNEGAAYRYIKKVIYFDPWKDSAKWGVITNDFYNETMIKNFNQLISVLKSYVSKQDSQIWKILVMKLHDYLPQRIKKDLKILSLDSLSLNEIRILSISALYGKPYFFLWVNELSNRSSFKELDAYLKSIDWRYWNKAQWTIPEFFNINPSNRKPFIRLLSKLRESNLSLLFKILDNSRFKNLYLMKNKKAYPGFRKERQFYIENLDSDQYIPLLFRLINLGDLNLNYLK